jgi:hypothetical protein
MNFYSNEHLVSLSYRRASNSDFEFKPQYIRPQKPLLCRATVSFLHGPVKSVPATHQQHRYSNGSVSRNKTNFYSYAFHLIKHYVELSHPHDCQYTHFYKLSRYSRATLASWLHSAISLSLSSSSAPCFSYPGGGVFPHFVRHHESTYGNSGPVWKSGFRASTLARAKSLVLTTALQARPTRA